MVIAKRACCSEGKIIPLFVLFSLFATYSLQAAPNANELESIYTKQVEVLQHITSIEYTITRELALNSPPYQATTHWWEMGNQYKYDYQFKNSKFTRDVAIAYNGNVTQIYKDKASLLDIQSGEHAYWDQLTNEMSLFTPFEFILADNTKRTNWIPRLHDFQNPDLLGRLEANGLDIAEVSVRNHPCIAVTLPGGTDRFLKIPVAYRVYFAKDLDFYPIGWDEQNSAHQTVTSYQITEIQFVDISGHKFYYPSKAKIDYFAWNPSQVSTKPVNSGMLLTIENVKLNKLSDSDFTINPGSVNKVWDQHKNVMIKVPR